MEEAEIVALAIALIGVAGSLLVTFVRLGRDSKTIEKIAKTTESIRQRIGAADQNLAEIRQILQETLVPGIQDMQTRTGTTAAYEENARLRSEYLEARSRIATVTADNLMLIARIKALEAELAAERGEDYEYEP